MSAPLHRPNFTLRRDALAGRYILITGASGGLGRALAIACAGAGASVILSGRNPKKLERVYDEITALGAPQPAMVVLDLATATAADYDGLARVVASEFGRLDGLVHAAALLGDRTPLEQYHVPTWCKVLHVNLTAPVILTQVLLPNLRLSPRSCSSAAASCAINGRFGEPMRRPRPGSNRCAACLRKNWKI
jgi:NAD(P)-dependent dehydrogenase (short-subunit alcohol dehydrogenase family)